MKHHCFLSNLTRICMYVCTHEIVYINCVKLNQLYSCTYTPSKENKNYWESVNIVSFDFISISH